MDNLTGSDSSQAYSLIDTTPLPVAVTDPPAAGGGQDPDGGSAHEHTRGRPAPGQPRATEPPARGDGSGRRATSTTSRSATLWSAFEHFLRHARRRAVAVWEPAKWTAARAATGASEGTTRSARRPGVAFARVLFLAILTINLLGVAGLWVLNSISIAQRATADLSTHLARVDTLLGGGGIPPIERLQPLQVEMAASAVDLQTLDDLLPLRGTLPIAQETAAHHAFRLGIDALHAGQAAISLAQELAPPMQALVSTVIHGPASPPPAGSHLFTVADQQQAQATLYQLLMPNWQAALADRQHLSADDLQVLHNHQLSTFVTRFDALAPQVSLVIEVARQLIDASPRLVGIENPEHILLLNMDTDELRATGGFLGNYADIEFVNGALVSGIHLHDVYTLDCPNNQCPDRPVPPDDSWFTIAGGKFAMRDSNLDPDFPTSAIAIEQMYQQESGIQADGIIAITPAVVESILRVIGPVTVPIFKVQVTADNLRDLLHYYHQNPQIALHLGISPTALGTSIGKVFDVLAAQAVLAKLQTLTSAEQLSIGKALLQDLATKDIQIFSNVEHVQDMIVANGVGGHLADPPFDSLAVVDTNDGATYANSDIRESIVDAVALNASGGAAHALSITYDFPFVAHNYAQANRYADFVRVIVPKTATKLAVSGPCTPLPATEASHQVLACQFTLARGSSTTLHFSWSVSNPTSAQGTAQPYSLLVARQPGASVQMQVTIAPPSGGTFAPSAGPGSISHGALAWSASPITKDVTITAPLQGK